MRALRDLHNASGGRQWIQRRRWQWIESVVARETTGNKWISWAEETEGPRLRATERIKLIYIYGEREREEERAVLERNSVSFTLALQLRL